MKTLLIALGLTAAAATLAMRCRAERHTGIPRARPSTAVTTKQSCKHPALSPLRA